MRLRRLASSGGALGRLWSAVFCVVGTLTLRGRRGTSGTGLALVDAAVFCVAGVAASEMSAPQRQENSIRGRAAAYERRR